jgi:predicted nicotinamide N-methyase
VPHATSQDSSEKDRRRLRQRLARRFEVVETTLSIGSVRFPFTRIADPDVVLNAIADAPDRAEPSGPMDSAPLRLPYWAELWESSIGIAQYLLDCSPKELTGQSVLDLGCGMGLAGCIAAHLGASVLFADLEPDALLFARLNSLAHADRVRIRRLDWRKDALPERFDLILGADILYERSDWEWLEPFWRRHLAPAGRVLLGEPGRQTGEQFLPWIADRPWQLTQHSQAVPTRIVPIRIFDLTLEE